MANLTPLNSKETKELLKQIEEQWGTKPKLNYAFLKNNQSKIFIVNKEVATINLDALRINSMGIYFCETERGIRLSIEGSQLIGKEATKNVLEVSKDKANQWMLGNDLETDQEFSNFVIIKHNNDFFGTGKFSKGKILNYVSKERRISAAI